MDNDIPLTQVRSNASSTGARKPNQGTATGFSMESKNAEENEKHGFFHRGRRQAKKNSPSAENDNLTSDEASLNAMGKLYNKIIHASVVTRYLVYIVPVALLLAVPLIVIPATGNRDRILVGHGPRQNADSEPVAVYAPGPQLFYLFLWIELAWLSLWVGKVVAHLLPPIFMFFTGVVSAGTRKYAIVIRALEIPLSLFFWAMATFFIFTGLINVNFNDVSWVIAIRRILGAFFASSAVFLIEKTIIQLISVTYHQRSFANRIKDSKREVFLLGLMYDASRQLFPMYCPEFIEEDELINDSIEIMLAGGKKGRRNRKGGAVTPMKLIGGVGRIGDKVTSVFGNLASEITGKQVFNPNSAHSIVVEALEKARTSEALAKRIWMSFVVEGNEALFVDDIIEVLGPGHRDEAEECFAAIDADSNGDISLDEMIRKVVETGKERKAIGNSMKDISQALAVFDQVLLFIVLLIVIFIFLAFFQSSFITTLATAGTALLSLSFVFAVTTQEFLGSCIFLFVKHPYDVGDRVDIAGSEKEQLVVEKISLLYTVFNRIDKMQVVQVPNIVLNNLWIENVTRSKAMKEVIDVNVSYDTSFEDIELLRIEMEKFVRAPENARDFQPDLVIGVAGVGDLDKLQLKIAIKHKSNWHNEAIRATRRSKFMCALTLALKRVPIYAPGGGGEPLGGPANPSYSVTVTDSDASAARDNASKEKEGKRMVPTSSAPARNPSTSNKTGVPEEREAKAAQGFNSLNPAKAAADEWGYNRDDSPRNSRDESSMERQRSNDIDSLRLDLHKRESQRSGRRRAGETLPPQPVGEHTPGFQVTQHMGPFDEEAQVGGPHPYSTTTQGNSLHPQASLRNIQSAGSSASGRPSGAHQTRSPSNPYQQR
ncbi:Mechanosensitive ion channel-domain-containing protein [Annulohypoxylon maeteangense]|uniref:Mechanosensitive ion channel-domain-containing protein n=1 Tax=Annulohypoxylon maeteangense TaxID=1927788 RepID=UPI0020072C3C|nr:Mechanosensitive ion channel-domain-containing protein [Annulohypoxylon maeteangense]KAI0879848.1 Mechanosensitive ion channel-domain-containing protein [Annulohypoxylon maeteangense]